jgi:hypothetical protein
MTKKMVKIKRKYEQLTYELCGTVDQVIERLVKLKDTQKEGETLYLEYETVYGTYGDADCQVVNLYDNRLETDEEYQLRLQREEEIKQQDISRKRAQLEKLKKELGED